MNEIIYVLTPTGERKPIKVNEDGELIVNVDATVASNVKIEDTNGDPILAVNGAITETPVDTSGDPLSTDNDVGGSQSLNVKLVSLGGGLLGQEGNALQIEGILGLTDPATSVLPIAIKDYLGANITSDNNDGSPTTSLNVKLLAADNTLLGQESTPLVVQGIVGGVAVKVSDSYAFPLITQQALADTEIDNALLVTGIYRRGVDSGAATFANYPSTDVDSYLGLLGTFVYDRSPIAGHFVKQIQNITIANKKYSGALSGQMDVYFVAAGSNADSYMSSLAIPDIIDLDSNFGDYAGVLQVISGVSPTNIAGISMYSADVKINSILTQGTQINIYLAATQLHASFGADFKYSITWEEIAAGQEF